MKIDVKFGKTPITGITYSKSSSLLAYTIYNVIKIFNLKTNEFMNLNDASDKHTLLISSLQFTSDGNTLVTASHDKSIKVWDLKELKCVKTINTNKKAIRSALVDNDQSLVISDKVGDVFVFHLNKPNQVDKKKVEEGDEDNLILGHFSSITDLQLTKCQRYIITSDRDEKIRVSKYPDAFDIASYCLGHTQFVSKVLIVKEKLVSGSGDGTLKLWDWKIGKLLQSIDIKTLLNRANAPSTITIPIYFDGTQLYFTVEDFAETKIYNMKLDNSQLSTSSLTSFELGGNAYTSCLVDEHQLYLSLIGSSESTPRLVILDLNTNKATPMDKINESENVVLDATTLKTYPEQILRAQFTKFLGLNEHKARFGGPQSKGGDDMDVEEDGEEEEEEVEDEPTPSEGGDRAIKLRKMDDAKNK